MDKNNVVSLAIDAIRGRVSGNFSAQETSETIRQAMIEMNGGSDKLNIKTFHRGTELYAFVEEIIPYIIESGLTGSEFFMGMVDYRNMAEGDAPEFIAEDHSEFVIANIGNGTQSVRRQRLVAREAVTLATQMRAIKIYEELNRVLAGRVDFNTFITKVGVSFAKQMNEDIFKVFNSISANTKGLNDKYVFSGSFDEDKLLDIIAHVEASTGKAAKIVGTKKALRKVTTAVVAHEAESDMYNVGHYGKFNGTDMVSVKQVHKAGTEDFLLDDNKLYILAGDDKMIKFVNEGEGLLIAGDPMNNADLTQEYLYGQKYGLALMVSEKLGIYNIA